MQRLFTCIVGDLIVSSCSGRLSALYSQKEEKRQSFIQNDLIISKAVEISQSADQKEDEPIGRL